MTESPARDWTSFRARIRSRTIYRRSLAYVKFVFSLPAEQVSREKTEIQKSSYTSEDYVAKIRTGFEFRLIIEMPHYEEFVARNERKSSKKLNVQLANVIRASSKPYEKHPTRKVLKRERGQLVPARSRKFIASLTPGPTKHGQWMVTSASGEGPIGFAFLPHYGYRWNDPCPNNQRR